jgi:hypothetical protein
LIGNSTFEQHNDDGRDAENQNSPSERHHSDHGVLSATCGGRVGMSTMQED